MTLIYKMGEKEDPGNYRPPSLTSPLGKLMEQIILSTFTWHVQEKQGIRPNQHGFVKARSCLTSLVFYAKVTILVDEGNSVNLSTWTSVKTLRPSTTALSWRN